MNPKRLLKYSPALQYSTSDLRSEGSATSTETRLGTRFVIPVFEADVGQRVAAEGPVLPPKKKRAF